MMMILIIIMHHPTVIIIKHYLKNNFIIYSNQLISIRVIKKSKNNSINQPMNYLLVESNYLKK
jgi:hypothetical protein